MDVTRDPAHPDFSGPTTLGLTELGGAWHIDLARGLTARFGRSDAVVTAGVSFRSALFRVDAHARLLATQVAAAQYAKATVPPIGRPVLPSGVSP